VRRLVFGKVPVLAYSQYFPFWDWYIVAYIPETDYMRPILLAKQAIYAAAGISVAAVLVTLLIVFRKRVDNPLQRLNQAAGAIAGGRFVRVQAIQNDELGVLADSFNKMSESLEAKDGEVHHLLTRLRISESRFRTLFENAPIGICVIDEAGLVQQKNEAMSKLIATTTENGSLLHFPDLFQNPEEGVALWHRLKSGEAFLPVETKLRREGNQTFNARMTAGILSLESVRAFVVLLEDITEQKRLEIQLRQRHKMEAIGALAGGIAHDFNNILGIILGNTELSLLRLSADDPTRQSLEKVESACLRAKEVLKQLLAFSRVAEERLSPIDIAETVRESLNLLRATIPATVRIRREIAPDVDHVTADATQVHQVLLNLCANAVDAMAAGGGELTVGLENKRLESSGADSTPAPGKYVCLTVEDTGHGISAEETKRIFDPYYTTKAVGKGTGLGLSVVHGIVKRHLGEMRVNSRLGKGTRFEIFLPAVEPQRKSPAETPADPVSGEEHVLLVDDETDFLHAVGERLSLLGYRVVKETDPEAALRRFREDPKQFDVVVTDMTMPGMTGDRLAEAILKIRPQTPVLLWTGYSERIAPESARRIGIRTLLVKPLTGRELAAAIRKILDAPE
jgi:PAS domain S-box-containing protein